MKLEGALIRVVGVKMMALPPFPGKALTKQGSRSRAGITSGAAGTKCRCTVVLCALGSILAKFLNSQQTTLLADGTAQATDR